MAMITTDTILSMFDEKGTILKWLKKLESVLATSTLESVETRRQGDNVYFDFIFADGTTITSDAVEVHNGVDGEDGQDGQDGQDGENGLDALSLSSAVNTNPVTGGTFAVANLLFNRNPVYGDNVICVDNYQNNTYILVCTVNEVTTSAVTLQIQNAYQLNAEGGGSGGTKLYRHKLTLTGSNVDEIYIISTDASAYNSVEDVVIAHIISVYTRQSTPILPAGVFEVAGSLICAYVDSAGDVQFTSNLLLYLSTDQVTEL